MENKKFFHLTSWSRETLSGQTGVGKHRVVYQESWSVFAPLLGACSDTCPLLPRFPYLMLWCLGCWDLRTARWEAGMRLLVGSMNAAAALISAVGWQKDTAPPGESCMRVEPLPLGLYASSWQNPKGSTRKPPVCYVRSKEGPLSAVVWCWRCL